MQGSTSILVSTGGASYLATSVQDPYFSCAALDVIAIHAYGVGDLTKDALAPYVQKAQKAGKKLIMQEWGMCYFDTSNNNCPKGTPLSAAARDANIKKYADSISQAGVPWMYWQIIPNADPHDGYDYEVRVSLLLTKGELLTFDFDAGGHRQRELGSPESLRASHTTICVGVRFLQMASLARVLIAGSKPRE